MYSHRTPSSQFEIKSYRKHNVYNIYGNLSILKNKNSNLSIVTTKKGGYDDKKTTLYLAVIAAGGFTLPI